MWYQVKLRQWPKIFPPLKRPWGLFRDGHIIGAYRTSFEAEKVRDNALRAERSLKKSPVGAVLSKLLRPKKRGETS